MHAERPALIRRIERLGSITRDSAELSKARNFYPPLERDSTDVQTLPCFTLQPEKETLLWQLDALNPLSIEFASET